MMIKSLQPSHHCSLHVGRKQVSTHLQQGEMSERLHMNECSHLFLVGPFCEETAAGQWEG